MSGTFWFIIFIIALLGIVIFVVTRPRNGESARRLAAANAFGGTDDERMWWFVGWDDHFMHAEPRNRPNDDRISLDLKAAYDAGYEARLAWSREFTR